MFYVKNKNAQKKFLIVSESSMFMEIVARGAEAVLYTDELYGQKVLVKERLKKQYRIEQIDEKLRKERTKHEIKLIRDARTVGVNTPQILEVDEEACKITMQFIEGIKVKEFFERADKSSIEKLSFEIGRSIGKLHSNDIIHGDMTTSNMIMENGTGDVYFIDFGLGGYSKRIEDKGVDLRLLHGSISSSHYTVLNICWRSILNGYREEYKNAEEVIKKIDEIEGRTRYAEVKKS